MTPHPNAEYLRALADGKRVMVDFVDVDQLYPVWDCSTTVILSLLRPDAATRGRHWSFHIEQTEEAR